LVIAIRAIIVEVVNSRQVVHKSLDLLVNQINNSQPTLCFYRILEKPKELLILKIQGL